MGKRKQVGGWWGHYINMTPPTTGGGGDGGIGLKIIASIILALFLIAIFYGIYDYFKPLIEAKTNKPNKK